MASPSGLPKAAGAGSWVGAGGLCEAGVDPSACFGRIIRLRRVRIRPPVGGYWGSTESYSWAAWVPPLSIVRRVKAAGHQCHLPIAFLR